MQSANQYVELPILKEKEITLALKREDLLYPLISGNKYRKLKYNLLRAHDKEYKTLLTFGGAFSNHIAALSFAGKEKGFSTIGIIRGEELKEKWQSNPTLAFAHANSMHFKFVDRDIYRQKETLRFRTALQKEFGDFYLISEGGTNALAVKGCEEILIDEDAHFNYVCTCVGTGGTIAGLINSSFENQEILGFPALKGNFLEADVKHMVRKDNWRLITDYHFGGYGKINGELVDFINTFRQETSIPLDPVYTGKMLFGLLHMIKNDSFVRGTKILAIHTGGLQGIAGMNKLLKKRKLPLLHI